MPCHVPKSRSVSSRRYRRSVRERSPSLQVLAVLNLDKPAEREAYDFLIRATSKRDPLWRLLDLSRQGDMLLCVVRWVHPEAAGMPFSLAEISLTETAVCWRDYKTPDAPRKEREQRCAKPGRQDSAA